MSTAAPTAPSPTAQTTNILGYYNPNAYNVSVASDAMGINTQVGPKSYVVDRAGHKINDPRLDSFARGGLLVKEFTSTPVPMVLLRPPAPPPSPATSVSTSGPGVPVQGIITRQGGTNRFPEAAAQPPSGSSSVGAMSVEHARKLGLIGSTQPDRFDKAPPEDTNGAAAGHAPFIDQVTPRLRLKPAAVVPVLNTAPDASRVASLDPDSTNLVDDLMRTAAQDSGLTLPVGAPAPTVITAVPGASTAAPAAAAKVVTKTKVAKPIATGKVKSVVNYDDKKFTTPGDLRKHLRRKLKDNALAEETLESLLPLFEQS